MGYQLSQFAETVEGLTGQQRVVFAAMCKVTDDRHGFFWMDADRFRAEYLPHIKSNSTLRNHISAIIRAGYVRKVHQARARAADAGNGAKDALPLPSISSMLQA